MENEVLFQEVRRTKYCTGADRCVILLICIVLGFCYFAVSHFKPVTAMCGKAMYLIASWLIIMFAALQNIVEIKTVSNDRVGFMVRVRHHGKGVLSY